MIVFVVVSCIDDNGTDALSEDEGRIVGTWNLDAVRVSVFGAPVDVTGFDNCLLETFLTFEADSEFHSSLSRESDGECATDTASGTWEFKGGSTYTIHADGLEVGSGTQELDFSNNNNTFSFSESDVIDGFDGKATFTFDRE